MAHPPLEYGWQNVTFRSGGSPVFSSNGGKISGMVTSTDLTIKDILPAGFSSGVGSNVRLNYQITMSDYRTPGWLITDVWQGTTPADANNFLNLAVMNNFASIRIAYTVNTTRHNLGSLSRARMNLSVGSGWLTGTEGISWGRQHAYLMVMGYDSSGSLKGIVLPLRFVRSDTANHLEYFEAEIPAQYTYLNKYALATLSGSGNPFQLVTLSIASHIDPSSQESSQPQADSGSSTGGGGGGGTVTGSRPGHHGHGNQYPGSRCHR